MYKLIPFVIPLAVFAHHDHHIHDAAPVYTITQTIYADYNDYEGCTASATPLSAIIASALASSTSCSTTLGKLHPPYKLLS